MKIASTILLSTGMALCAASPLPIFAQPYPARAVRMVVPYPPGGAPDLVTRLLAQRISVPLGQPVIVENRAGASSIIGTEYVARSAPDGYTLLLGTTTTHVTNVLLMRKVPYDPLKDFTPITAVLEPVTSLVVHPSVPANSVLELIAYAKRNAGKISYSSSGVGSVFHLAGESFNQVAGVSMVHVPYKGAVPALTDAVAGRIEVSYAALGNALPHVRAGKLRMLAVLEGARVATLPDVPTVRESLPGFEKPSGWYGFFGPAGLQQPVVARLNAEIVKVLQAPDVRSGLEANGQLVIASSPAELAELVKKTLDVFAKAVKAAGLKPE
ncbi:MAG: hypothetical protein A3I01_14425 [Betaproteobacteria bacterium RIFCSPLOWO2_02_FULL_65_24]|nr:MAG: hypothetical protein A3I01_14425 [Betaproteobacteria bacterium RIFCSPLOWO2_02_FULL_65_24]OGA81176.1 MAG: hypothetical protein A3G27_04365 [Betaproteobacteria bacterium RIFCSPLOWO2_12_FULL_66_14]